MSKSNASTEFNSFFLVKSTESGPKPAETFTASKDSSKVSPHTEETLASDKNGSKTHMTPKSKRKRKEALSTQPEKKKTSMSLSTKNLRRAQMMKFDTGRDVQSLIDDALGEFLAKHGY